MSLVPIFLAGAAALLLLRKPKKRALPPPPQDGEGQGQPPGPRRPGKDYVAPVGFSGGSSTPPPPHGGGLTFPGPSGPSDTHDPPPPPAPDPMVFVPGTFTPPAPDPIHWEEDKLRIIDDSHEVVLSSQLEGAPIASGTYKMRLVFTTKLSAPKLVAQPNSVGWDYAATWIYGQRETIDYEIIVNGAAAAIKPISRSAKNLDHKLQPIMFGCTDKTECGWNGTYTSFFDPRLTWENGLLARFDTRALAVDPQHAGILFQSVEIDVSFTRAS